MTKPITPEQSERNYTDLLVKRINQILKRESRLSPAPEQIRFDTKDVVKWWDTLLLPWRRISCGDLKYAVSLFQDKGWDIRLVTITGATIPFETGEGAVGFIFRRTGVGENDNEK